MSLNTAVAGAALFAFGAAGGLVIGVLFEDPLGHAGDLCIRHLAPGLDVLRRHVGLVTLVGLRDHWFGSRDLAKKRFRGALPSGLDARFARCFRRLSTLLFLGVKKCYEDLLLLA